MQFYNLEGIFNIVNIQKKKFDNWKYLKKVKINKIS